MSCQSRQAKSDQVKSGTALSCQAKVGLVQAVMSCNAWACHVWTVRAMPGHVRAVESCHVESGEVGSGQARHVRSSRVMPWLVRHSRAMPGTSCMSMEGEVEDVKRSTVEPSQASRVMLGAVLSGLVGQCQVTSRMSWKGKAVTDSLGLLVVRCQAPPRSVRPVMSWLVKRRLGG
jgi:hypothetical protein